MTDPVQHARAFFEAHPEIDVLEAFIVDINGQLRGKWVPVRSAAKVMKGQLRFPMSSFSLDIWGNEVPASGIGAVAGDPDGVCTPVPETLGVVTWTERPMAQLLASMNDRDGTPFFADPRHVLARVIDRYEARGWTPVVACELEFHLIDRGAGSRPARAAPFARDRPQARGPERVRHRRAGGVRTRLRRHGPNLRGAGHPRGYLDFGVRRRAVRDQPAPRAERPARRPTTAFS